MTFTATPQPSNTPPRVRLDVDSDDAGAAFTSLSIKRDGALIREQPFVGGPEALAFDYEAPFGVPVTYTAEGSYIPTSTPDWSESWASVAAWSGSGFSASGGKAVSTTNGAQITRSASGTIQRVDVALPDYVRVELLTAGDVVVCSVAVTSNVVLTGASASSVSGTGSFALTLSGGVATASAADASWSVSRPYTGTPTKVRVVSLYPTLVSSLNFSTTGYAFAVATDASGNVYATDIDNSLVRKFSSAGVEVTTGGFPISTPATPSGIAVDSSGNIFVVTGTNLVRKYNSSGVAGITFATTGVYITVDVAGSIYVADPVANLVRKYNSSGVAGITWSTTGNPNGIASDSSNNVYVSDNTNAIIRKYNSSGVAGITFSSGLTSARGVAVDVSGNVYVVDNSAKFVRKYNSAAVLLGSASTSPNSMESIAVDASGNAYTAHGSPAKIYKYTPKNASTDDIAATLVTTETAFFATITTQLDVDEAWLIHPSQPTLSCSIDPGAGKWRDDGINVDLATKPVLSRKAVSTVFNPVGRTRAVVVTHGNRLEGDWTLNLFTPRLQDRDAVSAIITDQTPLLFRAPQDWSWDLPDGWYSIGDVDENRSFPGAGLQNDYRNIPLPLTPVDPPIVRQGALWTYGDDLLLNATYADSLAEFPTYLDRLAGPVA